jgi:hypothetical protein
LGSGTPPVGLGTPGGICPVCLPVWSGVLGRGDPGCELCKRIASRDRFLTRDAGGASDEACLDEDLASQAGGSESEGGECAVLALTLHAD